ncbi:MAG: transketolase, partial [Deltaproteobacteria bacterium]|nr:transketolase [Deltaproteobacteria bacterium]
TTDDLETFRTGDSVLQGHPSPGDGVTFFDAATGSLGQGLSIAAGIGLAALRDGLDKRVYCIIGDGESREGQVVEAIDFIIDHKITNVLPIFNCNQYGQSDLVSNQQSADAAVRRLEGLGLKVFDIDGHDPIAIRDTFDACRELAEQGQIAAVVARTVKGWGVESMQGPGWHGKPATGETLEAAHEELKAAGTQLTSALAGDELRIYPPAEHAPEEGRRVPAMSFDEAMNQYDMAEKLKIGKLATRRAFGVALRSLGQASDQVYALDADVQNSTFSQWFAEDPSLQDRFVECKIAEQNMFSVGVGLSASNKIPFCSTFGKFVTRGYDQIEMAINTGANLKVVGSHSGVTLAADGPSQMALPDVAWFSSWGRTKNRKGDPACYLLQPADAYATYGLTFAMAEHDGVCFMRTVRPDVEFIYNNSTEFSLGGFEVLTTGRDLLIVTAGYMVHECNKVLDSLDKMGIDASLVDLYSIPFEADGILDLANENGGNILTVEDNYGGGLGSAISDACTESGDGFTIDQMYVRSIPRSARTPDDILAQCGLDHAAISKRAAQMLGVVSV